MSEFKMPYTPEQIRDQEEMARAIAKARLIPVWMGLKRKKHNSPDYVFTPHQLKPLLR